MKSKDDGGQRTSGPDRGVTPRYITKRFVTSAWRLRLFESRSSNILTYGVRRYRYGECLALLVELLFAEWLCSFSLPLARQLTRNRRILSRQRSRSPLSSVSTAAGYRSCRRGLEEESPGTPMSFKCLVCLPYALVAQRHQSRDTPAPAGYSFIHGVFPPLRRGPLLRRLNQPSSWRSDRQASALLGL
jgi:hypothetical protein